MAVMDVVLLLLSELYGNIVTDTAGSMVMMFCTESMSDGEAGNRNITIVVVAPYNYANMCAS